MLRSATVDHRTGDVQLLVNSTIFKNKACEEQKDGARHCIAEQ